MTFIRSLILAVELLVSRKSRCALMILSLLSSSISLMAALFLETVFDHSWAVLRKVDTVCLKEALSVLF